MKKLALQLVVVVVGMIPPAVMLSQAPAGAAPSAADNSGTTVASTYADGCVLLVSPGTPKCVDSDGRKLG